jgi:quercetin dioxygenase-like cupin family protein
MSTTERSESVVRTDLLAALPITTDATTSRVVVNNDVLRVVLFAMDAGQELTDHAAARAVTVQMIEGRVRFTVGEQAHDLVAGDVIYLAPNERHAVVALTPTRFSLVLVSV